MRAYLNDPRISGKSRAFHFGIDISAPDGTPVYAVEPGTVYIEGSRSLAVLSSESGRAFAYWHVVPDVEEHQAVRRFQRLGRIEAPWAHLHFAERSRQTYRNPLRAGGLVPWVDSSSPRIAKISFARNGKTVAAENVRGDVDVIVEAFDLPPLPVPPL